jgi:serine/threonine protein kinase
VALASGHRLGPYEILSALGVGVMGEVYKTRDTRLERTVAIKVLPAVVSSSAEVRQRFEREARTISSSREGPLPDLAPSEQRLPPVRGLRRQRALPDRRANTRLRLGALRVLLSWRPGAATK